MKHWFKRLVIRDLVKYNQWLLISCGLLSLGMLLLSINALSSNERWVLVPATSPDKRLEFSSRGYSSAYLQEWAAHVMQTLMTTSYDTVEEQVAELKVISSNSDRLNDYFKQHISFVKGSNIQSVFFPKKIKLDVGGVIVSGVFRYWLGSSKKVISEEKAYKLTYRKGPRGILLLKGVDKYLL